MLEVDRPIDGDVLPPIALEFAPRIALIRFAYYLPKLPLPVLPLNALFIGRDRNLHISAAGFSSWVGSHKARYVNGEVDKPLCPTESGIAAFRQTLFQLSVVYVGPGQQLHVVWRNANSYDWEGPSAMVGPHTPAPWAATIAAGRLPPQKWFVLFVDDQGAINSLHVDGGGHWQGPERTKQNLALPGGGLVAFNQTPQLLTVPFVEKTSRFVHVLWRETNDVAWRGPALIAAGQTKAPPGAAMATAAFRGNDNFLFYVDDAGALMAARVVGYNPWQTPERVSDVRLAPPGGAVAAVAESPERILVFFIGRDGVLRVFRRQLVDTMWLAPLSLTVPDFAKPGGAVSAAMQADDLAVVAFEGVDGRPYICWSVAGGPWQGPARISWSRMGAPVVHSVGDSQATETRSFILRSRVIEASRYGDTERVAQLTGLEWPLDPKHPTPTRNPMRGWGAQGVDLGANAEHDGKQFFFFGDVTLPAGVYATDDLFADPDQYPPPDGDLIAFTEARHVDGDGFSLTAITRHGPRPASQDGDISPFHPFTAERIGPLGTNETPTGAFSYGGRCYVFAGVGGYGPFLCLTSSDRPDAPVTFKMHGVFSKRRFLQAAPWVVKNSEHVGLPSGTGDGVVVIGGGEEGPNDVSLAWMPLEPSLGPDVRRILYYAGRQGDQVIWLPREADAKRVCVPSQPHGYTSMALARLEGPKKWLLIYHLNRTFPERSAEIVARFSDDLFRWSDEVSLFNPSTDPDDVINAVFRADEKTTAVYGGFPINRFTQWCPSTGVLTLYYLMSVFQPLYQVQLMRTRVKLRNVSPFTGMGFAIAKRLEAIVGR
jgi:hypothetical protein